ncbi:hypothetical protein IFM89_034687 [Coptis chinensis]|uniref:Uncharacterized protein n=1 Tax=Coptis chinensis TaxID=261450 RepID=A0A835LPK6_9MAGN|nr:hypothetical protein IFM89_034687 [Coptis chinensis]
MSVFGYSSSDQIDIERSMQCSRCLVPQRRQCKPARNNIRFDRSPGGSDSSESGYNGLRNTRRRTNGGYQRAGDRRDDVVAQALKNALPFDKSSLYNSLTLKPPETVQDLLVRADSLSELYDKLKEYLKGSQKLTHVNMVEHDVIVVCHAQVAICSSNRERKWSMKPKIQKIGSWNHVNSINFKSGFYVETIVEGDLTFTEEDERGVYYPHNDAVVITAWVGIRRVQRILIDTDSFACILFS